jgi:hypothetical protein
LEAVAACVTLVVEPPTLPASRLTLLIPRAIVILSSTAKKTALPLRM